MNYSSAASSAAGEIRGSTEPRLWTPELRELTRETSYGFDLIDFARDVVGTPFDPWQEWLAIHVGELLPDGRPRFRTVLILVARQNGKTLFAKTLILFWLFFEAIPLILGTSTDRRYAKRTWSDVCRTAQANPSFSARLGPGAVRLTIGEEALVTVDGAEYTFAANNSSAGRSATVHRWVCDELREHRTRDAWNAATNAMNAVPDGQVVCITNQGDDSAIVLDGLHESALEFLETGVGDPRLGLFEWSSPLGADPTDVHALAQANPNLGRRTDVDALLGAARRAVRAGGMELTGFKTEVMCHRVRALDPAVDPQKWADCLDVGDLAGARSRVALCLDLAPDELHATLAAAAVLPDGRVRIEAVKAWSGAGCTDEVRRDLPGLLTRVRPQVLGWYPGGPAAALAADLKARPGDRRWPPPGVTVAEIKSEATAVCMGFAEQVKTRNVAQSDDPLLNAHVTGAEKLNRAGGWVFSRRGEGHCDAAYAAAGAVHLARTLPPAVGRPRLVFPDE